MTGREHTLGRSPSEAGRRAALALICALWLGGAFANAEAKPSPALIPLSTVAPGIVQDMRYAGAENFVGAPIDGYHRPQCWLTPAAANALARVQKAARAQNLSLKVFDCYRPQQAVDHFARWARALSDTRMKQAYYLSLIHI